MTTDTIPPLPDGFVLDLPSATMQQRYRDAIRQTFAPDMNRYRDFSSPVDGQSEPLLPHQSALPAFSPPSSEPINRFEELLPKLNLNGIPGNWTVRYRRWPGIGGGKPFHGLWFETDF